MFALTIAAAVVILIIAIIVTLIGAAGMNQSHEGGMISFMLFFVPGALTIIATVVSLILVLTNAQLQPKWGILLVLCSPLLVGVVLVLAMAASSLIRKLRR